MTREETEKYGREIDAKNAKFENVEMGSEEIVLQAEQIPPPISDEEVKRRVGEQNYENMIEGSSMNSIVS